jgi:hypothetical protein
MSRGDKAAKFGRLMVTALAEGEGRKNRSKSDACQIDRHRFVACPVLLFRRAPG